MSCALHLGDCLEVMPGIEAGSVDAIIADWPYGTTACKWDSIIPLEPLWKECKRVVKPKTPIVLFGNQPFTTVLIMSNLGWFKYNWVWQKTRAANFMNVKNKPLCITEDICIFSEGATANRSPNRMPYYPQGIKPSNKIFKRPNPNSSTHRYHRPSHKYTTEGYTLQFTGYPKNILQFDSEIGRTIHPTQKPVALLEYLIKTYTNPGDLVLDNTMGSGSTGEACLRTGRRFIGIEKDEGYFEIAKDRLERVEEELRQVQITKERQPYLMAEVAQP